MTTSWLQLQLRSKRDDVARLEDALLECGALAVTQEDSGDEPILEPGVGETPLWPDVTTTALFEGDADAAGLEQALTQLYGALPSRAWETVQDRAWEREWMEQFEPIRCGQRLWICPSWHLPPEPGAVNLLLDPGLAFGTGTHPTTALCLEWLDGLDLAGKRVIDYGCGSGILGIAALLLGAREVIAVDNDPQALLATRDNAERNGIEPARLTVLAPEQVTTQTAGQPADILVANILAEPLVQLAPRLATLVRPGGQLCLSGLIQHQGALVSDAYREQFEFESPASRDEWLRLNATKRES